MKIKNETDLYRSRLPLNQSSKRQQSLHGSVVLGAGGLGIYRAENGTLGGSFHLQICSQPVSKL